MWKSLVVAPLLLILGCTSDGSAADPTYSGRQSEGTVPGQTDPPASGDRTPADSADIAESSIVDGPVMRHPVRSHVEAGLAAEVDGVLELDDGCLYLKSDENGERYPALWPAETRWDVEREVVLLPSGDEIGVGGSASGGGGYYYVNDIEAIAGPEAANLAGRCVDNTYGEIAVVNNYDTAIALD